MLPSSYRLRSERDFSYIYKRGRRFPGQVLNLFVARKENDDSRFGFVIAKKTIAKSHDRNRIKRILRAEIAALIKRIASGYDVIIQARPASRTAPPDQTREELYLLLRRASLL